MAKSSKPKTVAKKPSKAKVAKPKKTRKMPKPKPKLTPHEKEKRAYKKEISTVLQNIGFIAAPSVDNKHFIYEM